MSSLLAINPKKIDQIGAVANKLALLPQARQVIELQKCHSTFLNSLLTIKNINDQLLFLVHQELLSEQRRQLDCLNASQLEQMELLNAQISVNRQTTQSLTQKGVTLGNQLTHLQSIGEENDRDFQILDSTIIILKHDQHLNAQSIADIQTQQEEGIKRINTIDAIYKALDADLERLERDLEEVERNRDHAAQAEEEVWIEVKDEAKALAADVAALPYKAYNYLTDECTSYIKKGVFLAVTTGGGAVAGNLLAKSAVTVMTIVGGGAGLIGGIGCLIAYSKITQHCQQLSSQGERTSLV